MIDNNIILKGVLTSGLSGFCLLLFLFNISKFLKGYEDFLTIVLFSLTAQFVLSILYLILYNKLEREYKKIYFLNFLFNFATYPVYIYYIVESGDLGIQFNIFLIYSILFVIWGAFILKDMCKRGVYKLISLSSEEDCSICYEEITKDGVELKCKHFYHKECIDKWLQEHTTCPYCRDSLV